VHELIDTKLKEGNYWVERKVLGNVGGISMVIITLINFAPIN